MGQTIAEKIFEAHVVDKPAEDTWVLRLDAVFCHEITTPLAISDLAARGLDKVFDASKIKAVIDHVTPAKDSKSAEQGKVLRDWARRHTIKDFFDVGHNGVCHALFPEKGFARPGYTIIMGDSHTCTHGAFGAFAAGVGTTDLEVGILKGVCAFKKPQSIKVNLTGALPEGVYAKDAILAVIAKLGVNGATDMVVEFHGPVVDSMSMEGRMTLCNMAVEAGATSGICQPDNTTLDYLRKADMGGKGKGKREKGTGTLRKQREFTPPIPIDCCTPIPKRSPLPVSDSNGYAEKDLEEILQWKSDVDAVYLRTLDIDCSALEPLATVGYKPDEIKTMRELSGTKIDQVYIGSCTNGRIEDLRVAAKIIKGKRIAASVRAIVSPATPGVYNQALHEGLIADFMDAGFCVTNPTCGACLGMSNGVLAEGEVCASTTNRNFYGRMGKGGMVHLMSPAQAARAALQGEL
ncbi:MAG: 3-isopropylmalate dehydratase large subunit [Spirochaetaceae bacterium]|jgi:3-isopropylmalate/(R)-2-methylmalate dehydratase large subunit|nr:3-isopropylmalate dehydratase large subunit [Spirochaetaceae bacterium]